MGESRKSTAVGSEIFARSSSGLWVKSTIQDEGIDVSWQVRSSVVKGDVFHLDANGSVFKTTRAIDMSMAGKWISCGVIRIDDSFIEVCGNKLFDDALYAVMLHSAYMVAHGYGEYPEDVVEAFSDFKSFGFMSEVSYRMIESNGMFIGMSGMEMYVELEDDKCKVFDNTKKEDGFLFALNDNFEKVSFLISTIPI